MIINNFSYLFWKSDFETAEDLFKSILTGRIPGSESDHSFDISESRIFYSELYDPLA